MISLLHGDCREVLKTLPSESVDCIVTSPPYFGLRDYGTAQWDGGDPVCDHRKHIPQGSASSSTLRPAGKPHHHLANVEVSGLPYALECGKCGARRIDRQIGLEATPDAYVKELVGVFGECRRVLKNSGTIWINLGDSYAGNGTNRNGLSNSVIGSGPQGACKQRAIAGAVKSTVPDGLKPKDLIGIPWMVAFALRNDGWYLRSDIIWSKPNPMPESVTDRPTKAHEYLFLLSKSDRYFFDAKSIAEPCIAGDNGSSYLSAQDRATKPGLGQGPRTPRGKALTLPRNDGNAWNENNGRGFIPTSDTRNKRTVWEVATAPFPEAHFATFPPDLIEPCIKAGCPAGGTVLDPFGGAGTTGLVADRLQRDAILIELNPDYAEMAKRRIANDAGMFAEVAA